MTTRQKRAGSFQEAAGLFVIGALLVTLVIGLPLAPVERVHAATITVAAGEVAVVTNGKCSLREAIINANNDNQSGSTDCPAGSGADIIQLAAGSTYTLSDVVDTSEGADGLPPITSQITISGNHSTIRRDPGLTCVFDFTTGATFPNIEFRIFRVPSGGNLTLNTLTVSNGCADGSFDPGSGQARGGGINNRGMVTIINSTLSGNFAGREGGAIGTAGTAVITNSTLSGNSAHHNAGGIFNSGGMLTITNSTLSGNSAFEGAGITNFTLATATITNSTLSGNSATKAGGVINSFASTVKISSSTLSGNSASDTGGLISGSGSTIEIKNSIVSSLSGDNCQEEGGAIIATGNNLDTDGSCVTAAGMNFTQVVSTGPGGLNLDALKLNAPGTTRTHALLAGSAAINAASDCTDVEGNPVTTDQRGVSRPQGAACDVGAYEALVQSPTFFTLQGNGICLTLNLQTRQYILRTGQRMIAGIFSFRQSGQVIRFQSAYGDTNRLMGSINLSTRAASAVLTLPLSLGGGRFVINDGNITDNAPCVQ